MDNLSEIDRNELAFEVTALRAGRHELSINYANGWAEKREMSLSIAGHEPRVVEFPSTGSWGETGRAVLELPLALGVNKLILSGDSNIGPAVKEISASLLAGDVESEAETEDTLVLVQNIAAIAALGALANAKAAEAQTAGGPVAPDLLNENIEQEGAAAPAEDESSMETSKEEQHLGSGSPITGEQDALFGSGSSDGQTESALNDLPTIATTIAEGASNSVPGTSQMSTPEMSDLLEADMSDFQDGETPSEDSGAANPPASGQAEPAEELIQPAAEAAVFEQILVQAESGLVSGDTDGDTMVRDADNRETPNQLNNPTGLRAGSSGTGYLDFGTESGDTVTYSVNVPEAGSYEIHIRYASSNDRPLNLVVNSSVPVRLPFVSTDPDGTGGADGFNNWLIQKTPIQLNAGINSIEFVLTGNGPNIDAFVITPVNGVPNFPPIIAERFGPSAFTVAEGQTDVGSVAANDLEGDAISFSLADVADNALFTVDPVTGALAFRTAPDFEQSTSGAGGNNYTVVVTASDGSNSTISTVGISVTNVNEAPTLSGTLESQTVSAEGTTISLSELSFSDPDNGDTPTLGVRLAGGGVLPAGIIVDGTNLIIPAGLDGGTLNLEIFARDESGVISPNVVPFALTIDAPDQPGDPAIDPIYIQAEEGDIDLIGDTVTTDDDTTVRDPNNPENNSSLENGLRPGFTGTGYLDFGNDAGDTVTYTVTVAEAGEYDLNVRYASQAFQNAARSLQLGVNGTDLGSFTFPNTGPSDNSALQGFNVWQFFTETVALEAGSNTITFAIPAGAQAGPNLDRIEITTAGSGPSGDVDADVDDNLALAIDADIPSAAEFTVTGLDDDAATLEISFDGGETFTVVSDAVAGVFTRDLSTFADTQISVTLRVMDSAGNRASTTAQADVPAVAQGFDAVDDQISADGSTTNITAAVLLANDTGKEVGASIDTVANITGGGTVELTNGTVSVSLDEAAYQALGEGMTTAVSFDYTAQSGEETDTATATVTFTGVNDAPVLEGELNAVTVTAGEAGSIDLSAIVASDPDANDTPTLAIRSGTEGSQLPGGIQLVGSAIAIDAGVPAGTYVVELYASDGEAQSGPITFTVTVEDAPVEPVGPVAVNFEGAITAYSGQDNPFTAPGYVAADGTLELNDNSWKRVALPESYTVTGNTTLVFDLALGGESEIVAIGFDLDNDAFDGDRSIYQLAGNQSFPQFINFRGQGTLNSDGTTRFVIDLGDAHAGKVLNSLVFINDDDIAGNGLGTSTFSNVAFVENTVVTPNAAPVVVGGGIADRTVSEGGLVEIDIPVLDPDGDPLTYQLAVLDAQGNLVEGSLGLSISANGELTGTVPATAVGIYTIQITASDDNADSSDTTTSFQLTVENVNDAPVSTDPALEPYFGSLGEFIDSVPVSSFAPFFSDADGDALTLTVEGLPEGLSVVEGVIQGTPTESGSYTVIVRATDAGGLSDTLEFQFQIDGPELGEVVTVEAEAFTGLASGSGFFATGSTAASGNRLILLNQNGSGSVTSDLTANGLATGYYKVTAYVFDENDGASTFSLQVGDTPLLANGSATVTLSDAGAGEFVNPGLPRGTVANAGNLKAIAFETVVFVEAGTMATLTGQAQGGESVRIDRFEFARVEAPNLPPSAPTLDSAEVAENDQGAIVGTLSASDAEGGAVTFSVDPSSDFEVVDGQLKLKDGVSLDHEAGETVTVAVTATDASDNATTADLVVTIGDVNEAPSLADDVLISNQTFESGTGGAINLAVLGAVDEDQGDVPVYVAQLQDGSPLPAGFTLNGSVLELADDIAAGSYLIEVFASDGEFESESVSFTVTVAEPGTVEPFQPITIQAEEGDIDLIGDTVTTDDDTTVRDLDNPENNSSLENGLRPGFTGTGYLDFGNDAGDTVTYTVTVAEAGEYDLNVRYASQAFQNAARSLQLGVNGTDLGSFTFPNTGPSDGPAALQGFNVWQFFTETVALNAGSNTITFAIPAGAQAGPNLDRIEITEAGTGPIPVDLSADEDGDLALTGPVDPIALGDADTIGFVVAGRDADIVKVEISFDGGTTRLDVTDSVASDGSFTVDGSSLPTGPSTATVIVTDAAGNAATASDTFTIGTVPVTVDPFTLQAEDLTVVTVTDTTATGQGALTRVVDADTPDDFGNYRLGAVGGAYMDFGAQPGDAITINVDAPAAGTYLVTFRYGNGATDSRALDLSLNGTGVAQLPFLRGSGAGDLGWNDWVEQSVELELLAGANAIRLAIPAGNIGGPNIDEVSFEYLDGTEPVDPVESFSLTIEAETFAINDPETVDDTVPRVPGEDTNEPGATPATSGPGQIYDEFGLRPNYEGSGYLDMGNDIGDSAGFTLTAPGAGTYQLTVRYANGVATDRPMTLSVNGTTQTIDFPSTTPVGGDANSGWSNWQEITVDIELVEGANAISVANNIGNGPNIDNVTISRDGDAPVDPETPSEPGVREEIRINFQDGTAPKAEGYLVANFVGFGDRGNGYSYGFVTEASATDADGTSATPINAAAYPAIAINERSGQGESSNVDDGRNFDSYDPRLTGYAHFDLRGTYPAGEANRVAFEVALENGWYEVTAAVGDTGGANDSDNKLLIEGQLASDFVPTNFYKTELVTVQVEVEDGFLTLAAPDGEVTEIQYLDIRALPDLTPVDDREAPEDYAFFTDPVAIAGVGDAQREFDLDPASGAVVDIDPTSDIILGIQVAPNRGGALLESLSDGSIKLYETLTGAEVAFSVNTTAGFDSLTISPTGGLDEFTSYTLVIDGFRDRGSNADPDAPTREFQKFSTTFTTTAAPEVEAREVAFVETIELNGNADGASLYTSIEISPDGEKLYVGTLSGQIKRWDIDPQDGSLSNEQTLSLPYLQNADGARGIIGFVFDPVDPNVLWISDNYPVPLNGRDNGVPEFSGRVSKVTLGEGEAFTGTAEAYITGLPRSNGDHVTNSLEFRENPAAATDPDAPSHLLYLIQGSNSAMGQPDSAWGFRPERLLNAAILEIDPTREGGPFDVSTEPVPDNGNNRRFGYDNVVNGQLVPTDDGNLKNGGILINSGEFIGNYLHFDANGVASVRSGETFNSTVIEEFYDPYANDAVLKIFATGQRNGYDLVWHSNGKLYVSANGSAAGGNVPDDPTTAQNENINNVGVQDDYFFTIEEGSYSGHPNPLRGEFILNGGNPTAGNDPNQVGNYPVGTLPDPNYDADNAYSLGRNRSPNGAIEYKSDIFGAGLQNAVLFTEYSSGNDLRAMILDDEGNVVDDFVIRDPDGNVISHPDPLDVIEGPGGRLYLLTLNRSDGSSQIIRLEPAPGGIVADNTADAGGDLALVLIDGTDIEATLFQVNGLDDDIETISVSFDGGETSQLVSLNAQNRFTADISSFGSPVTAILTVEDDANNSAERTLTFTPGQAPTELVSLIVIQAEDTTPTDGTSVTTPNDLDAEIEIRTDQNRETGTGAGYVNGLRPGAFGNDGNTDNLDGVPGGYADFGLTNADFMTFNFQVPAESAGASVLRFRYANGGDANRPLQVEVNGSIVVASQAFAPTATPTVTDGWTVWSTVDIPVSLVAGQNSVTLRSIANTGPNIDQLEILVQPGDTTGPSDGEEVVGGVPYVIYEAENASLDGGPAIVSEDRTQSGDFVDFIGPDTETITWNVTVTESGSYGLDILYALGVGKPARPMSLSVNGSADQTLSFVANSNTGETVWGPQSAVVDLVAGTNTITVSAPGGVGPNVDYLRVTKEPISVFEPEYAEIDGTGRIELEATDGSANTVNGSIVDFYFTVAADGIYQLDTAANAGATNGQALTWLLNGQEIDDTNFPGQGASGEESVYIALEAGTQYQLRIISDAPGANGLDYLDVQPAPGNVNADISIDSLDPTFLENRLHFSYIELPNQAGAVRDFKESGTVRISNSGTEGLDILEVELDGPFELANPDIFTGLTLAAGQSIDVEVLFNRGAYTPPTTNIDATSTVFEGRLRLRTNDADSPITDVDLAGFWQRVPEGGQEPNVNEVWRIFGFGNRIEGLTTSGGGENSTLSTNDVFAKTDETEVLSPYWRIAAGVTEAKITQISAFHGPGGATIGIHNPGNKTQNEVFWNHNGIDNQRLLPNVGSGDQFATNVFGAADIPLNWAGDNAFGITVAGLSTDPTLNPAGNVAVPGQQQGHTVKIFQALDAEGNVIPNVFLGIMDYTGINYDYNDNMFIIEGVSPVGFGQQLAVDGLDDAAADDRLVFTSIDNPQNGQQVFRDEATFTISNDGFAPLAITNVLIGDPEAFEIVGATPTSIPAGGSAQVTVRFIGEHTGTGAGAELYNSTLTIVSNDVAAGETVIQLAGLAQEFSENGSEPTVAQIVEAFGYSTNVAQGELAGGGQVETVGDEVLMPYMQRLDNSQPVEVIQLAAFLQANNVARLGFHGLDSADVTNLFAQDDQEYQTVLPSQLAAGSGSGTDVARATINQSGPFGLFISVDGRPTYASWSDPEANKIDPDFGQLVGNDQGHLIRFFQALDANGAVIEGTFIGIQDYPGAGNYDYNDHMFVIKNVTAYELTAADDSNADGVNDALQTNADNDGLVDFFDPDTTPEEPEEPGGENRGDYVLGVNFGGGAIANDPVLGVALVAQTDPRVTLSGSINAGAGLDAPSNPNGANAAPGSAFATYEDGSDWTATIDVPNGTYVVVLHTQETYWNAPGQRQFDISVNGVSVASNLDPFAQAGGDAPIAIETVVTVVNGEIVIDLSADIDNAALNAVAIYEYLDPSSDQEPVNGTPFVVAGAGVTIDADDYDNGGQGVAYNDAAGLQGGSNGGRTGSDVEVTSGGDIGWISTGDWVEYTIDVANAGEYELDLLLSNGGAGGSSALVQFYRPGEASPYASSGSIANPSTGGWGNFVNRSGDSVALESGEQVVRVTFTGGQDFRSFTLTPPANPQQPFGGTAPTFTNGSLTVDASNLDTGGQGVAYNDNAGKDGGTGFRPGDAVEFVGSQNDIGHVLPGEWVEYTVNVPEAGEYTLAVNAKTPVTGATVAVSLAGGAALGTIALADGHAGGSSFASAPFQQSNSVPIELGAGLQTLRFTFDGPLASNGYVLDLRAFTLDLIPDAQQPFGGEPAAFTDGVLTIDAVDYDEGGQGIAYNDDAGLDGGTNGGRTGSGVEVTGGGDIGWIDPGDWTEYTIDVPANGNYSLDLLLSNGGGAGRTAVVSFYQDGSDIPYATSGTIANPSTGSFGTFVDRSVEGIELEAGTQVVRVAFAGGSQDFRSLTLIQEPASIAMAASNTASFGPGELSPPSFDAAEFAGLEADAPADIDQPTPSDAIFNYELIS